MMYALIKMLWRIHEGIVPHLRELQRQHSLALSPISLAELYERVYYSYEPEIIDDCDLSISATTLRHDLPLLANNRRHCERLAGLRIESL